MLNRASHLPAPIPLSHLPLNPLQHASLAPPSIQIIQARHGKRKRKQEAKHEAVHHGIRGLHRLRDNHEPDDVEHEEDEAPHKGTEEGHDEHAQEAVPPRSAALEQAEVVGDAQDLGLEVVAAGADVEEDVVVDGVSSLVVGHGGFDVFGGGWSAVDERHLWRGVVLEQKKMSLG